MFAKTIHITLAVLVYLSGIGFTINKHFCKGELVNMALFVKAEPCENHHNRRSSVDFEALGLDVSQLRSCCIKALEDELAKDCCSEEAEYVHHDQVIDQVDFRPFELIPSLQPLAPAIFSFSNCIVTSCSGAQWSFLSFRPPFIDIDVQELFQVYLI